MFDLFELAQNGRVNAPLDWDLNLLTVITDNGGGKVATEVLAWPPQAVWAVPSPRKATNSHGSPSRHNDTTGINKDATGELRDVTRESVAF